MAPVGAVGFGLAPVVVGGLGIAAAGTSAINAYNNFTGNNFLTNNNPNRTKNNWSAALDMGEGLMAALPFASKKGRTEIFGAEARARTLQTGKQIWQGAGNLASRVWNGAKNFNLGGIKTGAIEAFNGARTLGAQGWASAKNLGSQAITGVKNIGIRALNAADNLGYQARVLASELSPGMVTPDGRVIKPVPEPPTPRPLIEPQKNQPMRMQGNNPEGPQGGGAQGQGKSSGQSSSNRTSERSQTSETIAQEQQSPQQSQSQRDRTWKTNEETYHGPKPKYHNLGHHDTSSGSFRGGGSKTTPLPKDADAVYQRAIPTKDGRTWYGRNAEGELYRYQMDEEGFVHFNGREDSPRGLKIPNVIRKRFQNLDKDTQE